MDQIFGKVQSGAIYLNFLGLAAGSRARKGAFAFQDTLKWLVETEIAFFVEQQFFIAQQRGNTQWIGHAHFPEFFSQNLEYLAAPWSDLDEKLSRWS